MFRISLTSPANDEVSVREALDDLSPRCTESGGKLANEVYNSEVELANHGITETPTQFMANTKASVPASATPTRCADIMAAVILLTEKGR